MTVLLQKIVIVQVVNKPEGSLPLIKQSGPGPHTFPPSFLRSLQAPTSGSPSGVFLPGFRSTNFVRISQLTRAYYRPASVIPLDLIISWKVQILNFSVDLLLPLSDPDTLCITLFSNILFSLRRIRPCGLIPFRISLELCILQIVCGTPWTENQPVPRRLSA
jgi:hypothetical protein